MRRNPVTSSLRAIARLLLMSLVTVILYAIYRICGRSRAIVRRWSAAMAKILGVRVVVTGQRPTGAFLLVSNHLGYLDILVIGGAIEVVFVAKTEVQDWPVLGALASSTGTIYVDRQARRETVSVSTLIDAAIQRGLGVVLFPEGTSTDGTSVHPFKSALLDGAARSRLPVQTAAIQYTQPEAKWFDDEPFGAHAWRMLKTERIDAELHFGEPVTSADRKDLARQLHASVIAASKMCVKETPAAEPDSGTAS